MNEELKAELQALTARLSRLEDALDLKGVVLKPVPYVAPKEYPKTEAESISWSPMHGIGWNVYLTYRCSHCQKLHASNEIIKATNKDGLFYAIRGSCGQLMDVKITKHTETTDAS